MRFSTKASRSGQVVALLLAVLVVLLVALLWNADVHTLVTRKIKAQNAGDAAALAAARWQAHTLNLIGQLNIEHMEALEASDAASVDAITNLQARVAFAGPLAALAAAQAAAKINGVSANPELTAFLQDHARVASGYGDTVAGESAIPEPFPGAWREYSAALAEIASRGVVAAPDNARFYGDPDGDHILLTKDFYEAVAGRDWCWFFIFCSTGGTRTILDDFTGHNWFDPLPEPRRDPAFYENPEMFSVCLDARLTPLNAYGALAGELRGKYGVSSRVLAATNTWYFYDSRRWQPHWAGMSEDDDEALPLVGPVRPEYDYAGADAVVRVNAPARLTSFGSGDGGTRSVVWTAAARPFGFIEDSVERLRPNAFGLVLPAFGDVRLIPIDAASAGTGGDFDLEWRRHCREHVPAYLAEGPAALDPSCKWCRLIQRFEDPSFRKEGSDWLRLHSNTCSPMMYGNQRGGGTRRGH